MSMFDSYDNLPCDYIPNNSSISTGKYKTCEDTQLPHAVTNIKGNFIGYAWNYGDIFNLTFSNEKVISVYKDSIIYYVPCQTPTTDTKGRPGQQAYNVPDCISWTCIGLIDGLYIWVQDEVVTYPDDGEIELTLTPDMAGSSLQVDVYNFRWEPFHTFSNVNKSKIVCSIDRELTEKFKPGIYYYIFRLNNGHRSEVINKFMFIVE